MTGRYPRNTDTGRVVDTGPPRTNSGLTGLGAVGGKVGVGAGALRVLVEFITQYDASKIKQLEEQLQGLQKSQERNESQINDVLLKRKAYEKQLFEIQQSKIKLTSDEVKSVKEIRDLQLAGGRDNKTAAKNLSEQLSLQTGLSKYQVDQLVREKQIRLEIAQDRVKSGIVLNNLEDKNKSIVKEQVVAQKGLFNMQSLKANLLPKLGSLALGAIGGIFGGAVVGIGFAAAQALIDAVSTALTDIVDPANKARAALEGVTKSVIQLADQKHITLLEAAKETLRDISSISPEITPAQLVEAAQLQMVKQTLEKYSQLFEVAKHLKELQKQTVDDRAKEIFNGFMSDASTAPTIGGRDYAATVAALRQKAYAQALAEVKGIAVSTTQAVIGLAAAEKASASAAALAEFAQRQLADSIGRISGSRIDALQQQESNLGGPSAKTTAIQNQLDAIAESNTRNAYASQLNNLREERALLLLRKRLEIQGKVVDYTKLEGKFALVAIDARIKAIQKANEADQERLDLLNDQIKAAQKADTTQDKADQKVLDVFDKKIEALNKQGEAQDHINEALDLQYKLSQTLQRNEGESIADFLSRRANENRGLLSQQADLERQGQVDKIQADKDEVASVQEVANAKREAAIEAMQANQEELQDKIDKLQKIRQAEIESLNEAKDRIQLEIDLQENAEAQKTLRAQEGQRQRVQAIQKELEASQKADEAATESKRKQIEKQIKAEQDAAAEAIKIADQAEQDKLKAAIAGASTSAEVQTLIGELAGASRAYAELKSYLGARGLPDNIAKQILDPIKAIIKAGEAKLNAIASPRYGGKIGQYATGGVFSLNNSSTPFGQNVRLGEQGNELGIVLSNRVAKILRETQSSGNPPMYMTINRSDDPYRDKQRFGRAVENALSDRL